MNAVQLSISQCRHCGSKLPVSVTTAGGSEFCCSGCEYVFGLMTESGLERFYTIRNDNPPVCPMPVNEPIKNAKFEYCDDPEFLKKTSADGRKVRFYLEGMNCSACVWLLEKLPEYCSDVVSARVNLADSTIEVLRKDNGSFAAIASQLNRFGYRPHPLRDDESSHDLSLREHRHDLIRLGVAGVVTGNIMILSVSIYAGATGALATQFQWLTALLAIPSLVYCAWPFYRSAFKSLQNRRLNLDVPIVVAVFAGVVSSAWALVENSPATYFDSLSMLVFLLLGSRFLLKRIQSRHLQSVNIEDDLLVGSVRRFTNHGIENVSVTKIKKDDLIAISEGQMIPVDGRVESGTGAISCAVMTGESDPVTVSRGSRVEAGSRSVSGEWSIRVQNGPRETRLAKILKDTAVDAHAKTRVVHFADKTAQYFVALVLLTAVSLVLWFLPVHPREGFVRALALVIVTCPCVFGMAIPLSMGFAIRSATRRGIIIKTADAVEKLWNAKNIFFDKTATLTTGELAVVSASYEDVSDLRFALGLEENQSHPVARAITRYLRSLNVQAHPFHDVSMVRTGGVSASHDGYSYKILPLRWNSANSTTTAILSNFGLLKNDEFLATFELADRPRIESREIIDWAREQRLQPQMLSGDREHVVRLCAHVLGFSTSEFRAEMTPESKAEAVRNRASVMIGDGANDAPAFAAADVGIAVRGSLDVSLRAADIYLTKPSLRAIPELFEIAYATKRAIYRNLAFSAAFNIAAGFFAVSGHMTPLCAAILMPLSSMTILVSALLSGRKLVPNEVAR